MNETPNRSTGVTLTAVVSILGSALLLLLALAMLLMPLVQTARPGTPPYLRTLLAIESLFLGGLAAWGIATAIGLFRLRAWARSSTMVFSALLVLVTVPGAVAMAFVSMPQTPGAPPALMSIVKFAVVCFYAVLALIGVFWLYFFQKAGVRAQFGAQTEIPGSRPLSVSVIAWFTLIGGLMCLAGVFFPIPNMLFGVLLRGWPARLLFLAFAAIEIWLGIGLLRLRPLSRVVAIAFYAFGAVNTLVTVFLPGFPERIRVFMGALPGGWPGVDQYAALPSMLPAMLTGALVCAVPIWFLVARRSAFRSEQVAGQQPL
jgi:hypothetical protein